MAGTFGNEKLESIVLNEIKRQLVFLSDMNTILRDSRSIREERIKEQEKDLVSLERKLQELTEQKAVCLENYHAGILNKEQFREMRNEIAQMIKDVKSEHEMRKKEVDQQIKSMNKSPKDCEELLCYSGMDHLTRKMVEAFVDYIEIDEKHQIDIHWTFND